jgi:hypothetical protein
VVFGIVSEGVEESAADRAMGVVRRERARREEIF